MVSNKLMNVVATIIAFSIIRWIYIGLYQFFLARRLGCRPANKYPHSRLLGLDLHQKRREAFNQGRLNRLFLEHYTQFGSTWEERCYGERTINTIETANWQAIATTKFSDFQKHPHRQKVQHPVSGLGVFSSNGQEWRYCRNRIMPAFQRAQLSDIDSFAKFVDLFLALLPNDGKTVDLFPLLQRLFLDNSSEFIFGESLDSLCDKTGEAQSFLRAFDASIQGLGKRAGFFNGRLNFLFLFDNKTWKENYSKVHAFIDKHVARVHAEIQAESAERNVEINQDGDVHKRRPETGRYVLIHDMARAISDPVQLRFELINVFIPAREPNAIALSNALFFLARYPDEWGKLRTQALALSGTKLTYELLQGLEDYRYALFEGIRLQGPAPRIQRMAVRDTTLPCGGGLDGSFPVFVPKGTTVAMHLYSKFHDPKIWGEDFDEYRPSRFQGRVLGWDFTPFFGGPRICPASQQVISQCVYLLVRLAARFESIESRDDMFEFVENASVFAESANGVKVALRLPGE